MKLCKDCKHCDYKGGDGYWAECHHPKNIGPANPVSGETKPVSLYCSSQRAWDWIRARIPPAMCGTEGRWFEPKN